jgi:ClpP class serine protease
MHMDLSKMLEDIGIKVTFIYAGDHKVDGNAYEPLSEEVAADLKAEIDKMYDKFVLTVVRNRTNLSEQAVRDTQARCYQADDALAIGLIDAIQTPPDALEAYFNAEDAGEEDEQPDDPDEPANHREDNDMAENKPATPPAAAGPTAEEAAAAARTAERERVKAITTHPEAEGRASLASHLAMETDLSPEAAAGILKAAPKEQATVPEPKQEGQQPNYFRQAMDNSKQPNVGADPAHNGTGGGEDGEQGQPSRAKQIIALQERVQGKPKQASRSA